MEKILNNNPMKSQKIDIIRYYQIKKNNNFVQLENDLFFKNTLNSLF